jgi:hypothetical protein
LPASRSIELDHYDIAEAMSEALGPRSPIR